MLLYFLCGMLFTIYVWIIAQKAQILEWEKS